MMTLEMNEAKGRRRIGNMAPASFFAGILGLARKIADWHRSRRDYQKLMAMDDHLLKDLGLSRSQISAAMNQASPHARTRAMARQAVSGKGRPSAAGSQKHDGPNSRVSGFRQAIIMSSIEAAKSRELMTGFIAIPRGGQGMGQRRR